MNKTLLQRAAAILLLALIATPGLLAGPATETTMATGPAVTAPGEFPVVNEPVTINIVASMHPYTGDMNENWFTGFYEDKTGVHVEWEQIPREQAPEKINVLIAANELPDAFLNAQFRRAQLMVLGSAGTFLRLNDLIDEHSVWLKQVFADRPHTRAAITAPDGGIYSFPSIGECYHCVHESRAWVNKVWLDNLGLDMPTTTEELREVLRAFKTRDPNGNGKADEIPLAGAITRGGYNNEIDKWLMNAFIYTFYSDSGERSFLQVQDGQVSFVADTPRWREGLRYIKSLYDEGLIDLESFTQARAPGLKQKSESPDAQILGFVPSGSISAFNIYYGDSGRYLDWVIVPPLQGPDGFQTAYTGPFRIFPGLEVTSAAARPDVIARWADWFYTREGTLHVLNGEEGVGWRRAEPGETGANHQQAVYVRLQPYGRKQDFAWASTAISDVSIDLFNGTASTREDGQEPILFDAKQLYDRYQPDEFLPYLWFDEAESAEMAELQLSVKDFVVSADAEFITGRRELDGSDWDNYVRDLQRIGVDRYVELTQKSYNAYLAVQ